MTLGEVVFAAIKAIQLIRTPGLKISKTPPPAKIPQQAAVGKTRFEEMK